MILATKKEQANKQQHRIHVISTLLESFLFVVVVRLCFLVQKKVYSNPKIGKQSVSGGGRQRIVVDISMRFCCCFALPASQTHTYSPQFLVKEFFLFFLRSSPESWTSFSLCVWAFVTHAHIHSNSNRPKQTNQKNREAEIINQILRFCRKSLRSFFCCSSFSSVFSVCVVNLFIHSIWERKKKGKWKNFCLRLEAWQPSKFWKNFPNFENWIIFDGQVLALSDGISVQSSSSPFWLQKVQNFIVPNFREGRGITEETIFN